jgi:hypothetical protein
LKAAITANRNRTDTTACGLQMRWEKGRQRSRTV